MKKSKKSEYKDRLDAFRNKYHPGYDIEKKLQIIQNFMVKLTKQD